MILNSVGNLIKKYITKSNNNKGKFQQKFLDILKGQSLDINLIDKLMSNFSASYDQMMIDSMKDTDEVLQGIIWYTLQNYCSDITSTYNFEDKKYIIFGSRGSGKTSFVYSLIDMKRWQNIYFESHNEESDQFIVNKTGIKANKRDKNEAIVYEITDLDNINIEKYKIFIVIDSQVNTEYLYNLRDQIAEAKKKNISIEGIIITKSDYIKKNMGTVLNSAFLLKTKVIAFTEHELKSPNRKIYGSDHINSLMIDVFFDSKDKNIEVIKSLFSNNLNAVDLHTYKIYIEMIIKMNSLNLGKLTDLAGKFIKDEKYKDMLGKIGNIKFQKNMMNKLAKQIVILNSMRGQEKKYPWMVGGKQITRIAYGAGVSGKDVKDLLRDFDSYKGSMKMINNYKFNFNQ